MANPAIIVMPNLVRLRHCWLPDKATDGNVVHKGPGSSRIPHRSERWDLAETGGASVSPEFRAD
ncbi:unnamed protein product [Clonostachys rosea f. rosea IK726]|uniref:Uncharacterized protein n=1 Tax=Clonostachys rosea f. rosea IK726 TaxID=1349383 RepID=A0ACA9UQC9_BIOOC|nr:unnamed protein product [Clonostachys rosea f. rosea IK726]